MNHFAARVRSDGRWEYTCRSRTTLVFPLGYCAGWRDVNLPELEDRFGPHAARAIVHAKRAAQAFEHRYHDDGHATREEAEGCYRLFLLDQHLRLDGQLHNVQRRCAICGQWTDRFAEIAQHDHFVLCDEHCTRELVEKLFDPISESWRT